MPYWHRLSLRVFPNTITSKEDFDHDLDRLKIKPSHPCTPTCLTDLFELAFEKHEHSDPSKDPPRALNQYMLFKTSYFSFREEALMINPAADMDHPNEVWRGMSKEDKGYWKTLADLVGEEHLRRYPGYKYKPNMKKSKLDATTAVVDAAHVEAVLTEATEQVAVEGVTVPQAAPLPEPKIKRAKMTSTTEDDASADVTASFLPVPAPANVAVPSSLNAALLPVFGAPNNNVNTVTTLKRKRGPNAVRVCILLCLMRVI